MLQVCAPAGPGMEVRGWRAGCRLAHEEAQGCETAVTVPSGRGQSPQDGCVHLFPSAAL